MLLIRQLDESKDAAILVNVERVATWFVRSFAEGSVVSICLENGRESRSVFRVTPKLPYEDAEAALLALGRIVTSLEPGVVSWGSDGWRLDRPAFQ